MLQLGKTELVPVSVKMEGSLSGKPSHSPSLQGEKIRKIKSVTLCLLSDNLSVFIVISQIFFTIILQWFYCFWLVFTLSQCWFSGKEPSLLWSLKVHLNLNQLPVMILGRFSSVLRHSCSAEGLCSLFQGQQDNMSQYQHAGQVHLCTDSLQQDVF